MHGTRLGLVGALLIAVAACGEVTGSGRGTAGAEPSIPAPNRLAATEPAEVVLVRGIFDADGRELLQLEPMVTVPGDAQRPAVAEGMYFVEVTYADGTVSRVPFDALIEDDSDPGRVLHGYFEVSAPLAGEIASVRIVDGRGGRLFAEVPAAEITGG